MNWEDNAIVLSSKRHGETSSITNLLTEFHGRHAGYVQGAFSKKLRGVLQPGNFVKAIWRGRIENQLGNYKIELISGNVNNFFHDSIRLSGLSSACALCLNTLPEREECPLIYNGLLNLTSNHAVTNEQWIANYIYWELSMLSALGFGLDLGSCAVTGVKENLRWVSPKTGRAVCETIGLPYKNKLLKLPEFVNNNKNHPSLEDLKLGLKLTGHFFEYNVLSLFGKKMPQARLRFLDKILNSPSVY